MGIEESGELISRTAAATMLHVTTQTIDRWIRLGRVRGIKVGHRVMVPLVDATSFAERHAMPMGPFRPGPFVAKARK